jgi:hypothetical protein
MHSHPPCAASLAGTSSASGNGAGAWPYGWDRHLSIAYRKRVGSKCGREHSLPIELDVKALDDAPVEARFADGTVYEVMDVTKKQYRDILNGRRQQGSGKNHSILWEKERAASNHRVFIEQRLDRELLLSVYEKTRQ